MCGCVFMSIYVYILCLLAFLQIWENVQRHVSWRNCAEHPDRHDQERIPVQGTDFRNTEDQRHLWNKVPFTDREVREQKCVFFLSSSRTWESKMISAHFTVRLSMCLSFKIALEFLFVFHFSSSACSVCLSFVLLQWQIGFAAGEIHPAALGPGQHLRWQYHSQRGKLQRDTWDMFFKFCTPWPHEH